MNDPSTMPDTLSRRCILEVNLDSLHHNLQCIQSTADKIGSHIMAVIKANAYGHGAIRIATECLKHDVRFFGVATVAEAIELRQCPGLGVEDDVRILVFDAVAPAEFQQYATHHLDLMLSGPKSLDSLQRWTRDNLGADEHLKVHCMVDTGMTRIGFRVDEALHGLRALSQNAGRLHLEGVCTHFADALNREYTLKQLRRFEQIMCSVRDEDIDVPMVHCANSNALMGDMLDTKLLTSMMGSNTKMYVRVGGSLYGSTVGDVELRYLSTLKAQIRHLTEVCEGTPVGYGQVWVASENATIATITCGYADGYPFDMSQQRDAVRIGDERYDIAGRVCMDTMMLYLGPTKNTKIKVGDYVVLWGPKQQHKANLDLEGMSDRMGERDRVYSLFCSVNFKRVHLMYTNDE